MKKWMLTISLMLIVSMFVVACGSDSSSNSETNTNSEENAETTPEKEVALRFSTNYVGESGQAKIIQAMVDEFNDTYKGKAKVTIDGTPDAQTYYDKNKTSMATDTVADIFYFQYNSFDAQRYYGSGKLIDLTPHLEGAWGDSFYEADKKTGIFEGKSYSVPLDSAAIPIYYNKELFQKAGIAEFPKTWEAFIEACDKLMAIGITPISLGTGENAWSTQLLFSYIMSSIAGPDFWSKSFTDPAYLKGAKLLKTLFKYTTKDAVGANYATYASYFLNEKTAMIINGPWMIGSFTTDAAPGFLEKVGVGASPAYTGGAGAQGAMVAGINFVLTGKKQTDPTAEKYAVEFMKYLTAPENAKRMFLDGGNFMESSKYEVAAADNANPVSVAIKELLAAKPYGFDHLITANKTTVQTEFPASISALVLGEITEQVFIERLEKAKNEE